MRIACSQSEKKLMSHKHSSENSWIYRKERSCLVSYDMHETAYFLFYECVNY